MNMSKRGIHTSKLRNVIQVLVLGNKSGVLTVTTDTTARPEEARIVFIRGTITEVRIGNVSGQRALHALLQWGICSFVFSEVETTTEPQRASFAPPPDTAPRIPLPYTPLPATPPPQYTPYTGFTGSIPLHDYPPNQQYDTGKREIPPTYPHTPVNSLTVPVRLREDAESFQRISYTKLSRTHMHLFFLINGKYTIQDLARLLHRTELDIEKLLIDLQSIGIIRF